MSLKLRREEGITSGWSGTVGGASADNVDRRYGQWKRIALCAN